MIGISGWNFYYWEYSLFVIGCCLIISSAATKRAKTNTPSIFIYIRLIVGMIRWTVKVRWMLKLVPKKQNGVEIGMGVSFYLDITRNKTENDDKNSYDFQGNYSQCKRKNNIYSCSQWMDWKPNGKDTWWSLLKKGSTCFIYHVKTEYADKVYDNIVHVKHQPEYYYHIIW